MPCLHLIDQTYTHNGLLLIRICPGRHMAKDTAFITIASVLSVFDIKPAIDETTGLEIPIEQNMSSHIVS